VAGSIISTDLHRAVDIGHQAFASVKIRSELLFFFTGVIVTFLFTMIAIHGNNVRWQCEAYQHYSAVWKMDIKTGRTSWMWLDDFLREELEKASLIRSTPTPSPIFENL